jgi:hypothetical protein
MKRFGSYLAEKRMTLMYTRMPGARAKTVNGLENPSPREVKALLDKGEGQLRWVCTRDRFLCWNAYDALHAQVMAAEFGMELMPGGTDLADHHYDEIAQGFIYIQNQDWSDSMFDIRILDDEGGILARQRTFTQLERAKR